MTTGRQRLIIAGAGVAGLEALTALSAVAPKLLETTVLAPQDDFVFQAHTVEEPFARPVTERYSVREICADHGAAFVKDALAKVDPVRHRVITRDGTELPYEFLLVAVGAVRQPVFEKHAIVFRGQQDAEAIHGLVEDIEGGYVKRTVFVVPSGVTWPLPLYELALMASQRAREMGQDGAEFVVITPEERPLAVFGQRASAAVQRAFDEAGIEVMTDTYVDGFVGEGIVLSPSGRIVPGGRVVTVPRLSGPGIPGLPNADDGFIFVDEHGQVHRTAGVFAAGDGTTFPVKQGGIAAQQADAAALAIAKLAGADVEDEPFDPVLRAKLLTGSRAEYLREALGPEGGEETSVASEHSLWWPPAKVAAPYLTGYLEGLAERPHGAHPAVIHATGDPSGGIELLES